jgi:hypothetical protein
VEKDDLDRPIWGVRGISAAINRTQRQTYYLLENGLVPGRKIGRIWVSTSRRLRDHFVGDTTGAS